MNDEEIRGAEINAFDNVGAPNFIQHWNFADQLIVLCENENGHGTEGDACEALRCWSSNETLQQRALKMH